MRSKRWEEALFYLRKVNLLNLSAAPKTIFLNHSRKGVKLASLGVVPPSLQFFEEFSRAACPPEQHVLWKRAA